MYQVSAGFHDRQNCPVSFEATGLNLANGAPFIQFENGQRLPAQIESCGDKAIVTFILDYLLAGETAKFDVVFDSCQVSQIAASKTEKTVEITDGGRHVTKYYHGDDLAKPYMGPFFEKYGSQLTRVNFEVREHPHHRSLWVSHGDVNGVDNWNERPEHGYIINQSIEDVVSGGVYAGFTAKNLWTTHGKEAICDEITSYRIYATPDHLRIIDVCITLSAAYKPVVLGNTKEAGPIAVRMEDELTVRNTGRFETPTGVNEGEIWMKRAAWCDYYGTAQGHVGGVAILDNPENADHPTYWHARNYGLMAANNSHILGPHEIKQGESMTFKYRVIIHNGDTRKAGIACKFSDYAAMPVVEIAE